MELAPINTIKTMDSRDIAEITGKDHSHVCRDIRTMIDHASDDPKMDHNTMQGIICIKDNRDYIVSYKLDKSWSYTLVSGYSISLRKKIIDRWMELEAQQTPKTFAQALRLAADQAEIIEQQQRKIELDAPKVEAHDALMRTEDYMSITAACKHFGVHPKRDIFPFLMQNGYLTQKRLPSQKSLDMDIMSLREAVCQDGKARPQVVVKTNQLDNFRRIIVSKVGLV